MEIPKGLAEQYPDYETYWVLKGPSIPYGKVKPNEFIQNKEYLSYIMSLNKRFRNAEARLLSDFQRQRAVLNMVEEFLEFKKVPSKASKYTSIKHSNINSYSDVELEECMTELKKLNEKIIFDINTHVENGSIAIAKIKEFIKTYDDQRHKHLLEVQRKKKFNSKH